MKVTGDSSHNYHNPQVKSQKPSRILHKTQKSTIIVCAKLKHTNYGNSSGTYLHFYALFSWDSGLSHNASLIQCNFWRAIESLLLLHKLKNLKCLWHSGS